ncbi:MAG: hypothetical protein AAF961_12735 [Planctomycetota bacterium]
MSRSTSTLVCHQGETPREKSTCGWRDRSISREDQNVAAWVHAVDVDGAGVTSTGVRPRSNTSFAAKGR